MNVYQYLRQQGISYTAVEHPAIYTMDDAAALQLPHPESFAKNLFLRDDKKRNYMLLVLREHVSLRLKDFQRQIGSRPLSFASEDDLMRLLGLSCGAVSPLGVLNDEARSVTVYLDAGFQNRLIAVHPNDNTATVYLPANDLAALTTAHGNPLEWLSLNSEM